MGQIVDQDNDKRNMKVIEGKLKKLLEKGNVPTLPMVAQKLVELCKDDNANFLTFANVLESDQGLASRILRVANSAYYGLRIKATSLERAITALGLKYVKSISLGFHLASTLSKFNSAGFDMEKFWQQSLVRAVLGRQLANHYCPRRSEEAFLVGLLQDCGVLFLAQVLGDKYAMMWRDSQATQSSLYQMEKKLFEFDHVTAASVIMEQWSLPELLAESIRNHHRRGQAYPSTTEHVQLRQIAYFTGTVSLNRVESFSQDDITLADYCGTTFGLDKNGIGKLLEQTQQEYSTIAQLFAGIVPDQIDITELLSQSRDLLNNLAEEASRKVFNCEKEIKELESRCNKLSSAADHYYRQKQIDVLTGLKNRQCMTEHLDDACKKVQESQAGLTVLFIDVDDFTAINKTHGDAVGNKVLQKLAGLLQMPAKGVGEVFRYGDDKIVFTLTGIDLQQSVQLTEAVMKTIRRLRISELETDSNDDPCVTCSIGMVFCEAGTNPGGSARILELADNQMHKAKDNGKNCFQYEIIAEADKNACSASTLR